MASFVSTWVAQFFDDNGEPLNGGLVYTYVAGTVNTPIATYPSLAAATAGTPANTNPIVLDQWGTAPIVITAPTKFVVTDSEGSQINRYAIDNFEVDTTSTSGNLLSNVVDPNGNIILKYSYVANAENYIEIINAVASTNPTIRATGTNSTGILLANGSGTNPVISFSGATANGIKIDNKSAASATADGTQTITASTETTVQFATEVFDKNSWYNNTTYIYTPLIPGVYRVTASIVATVTTPVNGAATTLIVRKNSTTYRSKKFYQDSAVNEGQGTITCLVDMNGTTDTISIRINQAATTAGVFTITNTSFLDICLEETT